jgi:hypothetical protein
MTPRLSAAKAHPAAKIETPHGFHLSQGQICGCGLILFGWAIATLIVLAGSVRW